MKTRLNFSCYHLCLTNRCRYSKCMSGMLYFEGSNHIPFLEYSCATFTWKGLSWSFPLLSADQLVQEIQPRLNFQFYWWNRFRNVSWRLYKQLKSCCPLHATSHHDKEEPEVNRRKFVWNTSVADNLHSTHPQT